MLVLQTIATWPTETTTLLSQSQPGSANEDVAAGVSGMEEHKFGVCPARIMGRYSAIWKIKKL